MTYHLMQKIDAMTPWHSLQTFKVEQEAKWVAMRYAAQRPAGAKYPQYAVNGMIY